MSVRNKLLSQRAAFAAAPPAPMTTPASDWSPRDSEPPLGEDALIPAWFRECPVPLMLLDPVGTVLEINPAAAAMLGKASPLVRGAQWKPLLPACAASLDETKLEEGESARVPEVFAGHAGSPRKMVTATRFRHRRRWAWLAAVQEDSGFEEIRRLRERLDLERMITSLSTHFLNLTATRIDAGIKYALRVLGEWSGADRVSLLQYRDEETLDRTHEWTTKELRDPRKLDPVVDLRQFPWIRDCVRALHAVLLPTAAALPVEAEAERKAWEERGSRSLMLIPLLYQGEARGYINFEALRGERDWTDNHVSTIRVAGELLINALERKKTDQALQEATQKYLGIFENALEGIYQTTPDGRCLSANPAAAAILGYASPEEMLAKPPEISACLYVQPGRRQEFVDGLERNGQVKNFESQVRRKDGSVIWISEHARAVRDEAGRMTLFEGMVMDITQRKLMEERILHDALHDSLTGLPNRVLFLERVGRALERAVRRPGDRCGVLLLDLDRFKMVNDSMGHTRGDTLLMELARRFARLLPAGATLARLGGDEFGFLVEDVGGVEDAVAVAARLLREMAEPIRIEDQEVFAPGSIGIALGTASYRTPEEILRDADTALNRAKGNGKGCYALFDDSMHVKAVHLMQLETNLRKAMDRNEFLLHYQPIVSLKDRRLMGFEALVRWRPQDGTRLIPPSDFIPVAEETGIILQLGKWVVEEAARQLRRWQDQFPGEPPLTMAVNISGKQLEDTQMTSYIHEACAAAGVSTSSLKLELTESALMGNPDKAAEVLRDLRDGGFQLSLDDFGTGYSSLSYLHRFPFQTLKIDRSFVARLDAGNKEDEIIRVINSMAGTLGMDVVAEGIESAEQLMHLQRHGVLYGQGYYFSRPLDVASADRTLRRPESLWPEMAKAV